MNVLAKITTIAAAIALTSQPCFAAVAADGRSEPAATTTAASAAAGAEFNLERIRTARIASASLSIAASQQTAAEVEEQPKRRGPGTTWLVIGGVALLAVVVLAVVASGSPTPGPHEGAFD